MGDPVGHGCCIWLGRHRKSTGSAGPSGGINLLFPSPEGHFLALGVYQSFVDRPTSAWCALPHQRSVLAMRLDKRAAVGSSQALATLYRWQGAFVAVEVGERQNAGREREGSVPHRSSLGGFSLSGSRSPAPVWALL